MARTGWRVVLTVGSLAAFVAIYAWISGWPFALGFGLIILAHELGHYLAAIWRGVPVTSPVFIPLIGAFVILKEKPASVIDESIIAAAGPVTGLVATLGIWSASMIYPSPTLQSLAFSGFALHLLNLLPVSPLDGGRIIAGLSRLFERIALPVVLFLSVWAGASFFTALVFFASKRKSEETESVSPSAVPANQKVWVVLLYLGLVAANGAGYGKLGGQFSGIFSLGRPPSYVPNFGTAVVVFAVYAAIVWGGGAFARWAERVSAKEAGRAKAEPEADEER